MCHCCSDVCATTRMCNVAGTCALRNINTEDFRNSASISRISNYAVPCSLLVYLQKNVDANSATHTTLGWKSKMNVRLAAHETLTNTYRTNDSDSALLAWPNSQKLAKREARNIQDDSKVSILGEYGLFIYDACRRSAPLHCLHIRTRLSQSWIIRFNTTSLELYAHMCL